MMYNDIYWTLLHEEHDIISHVMHHINLIEALLETKQNITH